MRLLDGTFKTGDTVFVNLGEGKIELALEPEKTSVN